MWSDIDSKAVLGTTSLGRRLSPCGSEVGALVDHRPQHVNSDYKGQQKEILI